MNLLKTRYRRSPRPKIGPTIPFGFPHSGKPSLWPHREGMPGEAIESTDRERKLLWREERRVGC